MAASEKPKKVYDQVRFKLREPAVYNKHYKTNLLANVKTWDRETRNFKIPEAPPPPPPPKTDEVAARTMAPVFKPITSLDLTAIGDPVSVNQYTIKQLLGKGAEGTVKLATDTKRLYAIKIINCDKIRRKYFINAQQLEERLKMEVNVLMALDHPNIIKFYEALYNQEYEKLFIVLQYCGKDTVYKFYQSEESKNMEPWNQTVRSIVKGMVAGLEHSKLPMHKKQIVHRDIKAENVLLSEGYIAKLCDFNISSFVKRPNLEACNKFLGTKLYNPPELILSKVPKYSPFAGDIWCLGITILQLFQRKHPFANKNIQQLEAAVEQKITFPDDMDNGLKDLLTKMLQIQWEKRIPIEEIVRHPWLNSSP